jgi:inner membrane protein
MNSLERISSRMGRFSVIIKVSFIAALLLLLLIPLAMIQSLVGERENRRNDAEREIFSSWGGEQTIAGPFLTVPYIEYSLDSKGKRLETVRYARFLPESLFFDAEAEPETRFRGIYDATVYTAKIRASGSFIRPGFGGWRIPSDAVLWEAAFVSVELPDMRALQERVTLTWGSRKSAFETAGSSIGVFGNQAAAAAMRLAESGEYTAGVRGQSGEIRAAAPGLDTGAADVIPFSFDLVLRGGGFLGFLPLGGETSVRLRSLWQSPSFIGSFLPSTRSISDKGFEASWNILSIARIYPQRWLPGEVDSSAILTSAFGVNLMTTVDSYMKVTRAVKYGILFLILPFLTLFLFEVYSGRRIHPLQYLFVGFAECIFYLLLLSLSEHMPFWPAYLAASAASTGLITVYACAIAGGWKRGIAILPVLAVAYIFLALVLQSEDYALLVGSLGLFLILAAVMMLTRRIDWYRVGHRRATADRTQGQSAEPAGDGLK